MDPGRRTRAQPLRPLSARSVALSVLLGAHPPELQVGPLLSAAGELGVAPATMRVALSRMVAAGDLNRADGGTYRLSERLLARQARQDAALNPTTRRWNGDWELAIITATGRPADERAALRTRLTELRVAELREGVWLRPANLARPWPDDLAGAVLRSEARPDRPDRQLAEQLWDLPGWSQDGHWLIAQFEGARGPAGRLAPAAAIVRHLVADPVLPEALLPADWPGEALRTAYDGYRSELIALARHVQSGDGLSQVRRLLP